MASSNSSSNSYDVSEGPTKNVEQLDPKILLKSDTKKFNPDLHLYNVTKEGEQRWLHTYPDMDDASLWYWWIHTIPIIEERLSALEEAHYGCSLCGGGDPPESLSSKVK